MSSTCTFVSSYSLRNHAHVVAKPDYVLWLESFEVKSLQMAKRDRRSVGFSCKSAVGRDEIQSKLYGEGTTLSRRISSNESSPGSTW